MNNIKYYIIAYLFIVAQSVLSFDFPKLTWVHGDKDPGYIPGVYGEKGVPNSIHNYPGSRHGPMTGISNSDEKLWLFGGVAYTKGDKFNDLWSYSIRNNEWVWISGTNIPNDGGNYVDTTKDLIPRSRYEGSSWYNEQNKTLYIFGGLVGTYTNPSTINDLWSYSVDDDKWEWIGGSSSINVAGKYSGNEYPGSRYSSAIWVDESFENVWIFGGAGCDSYYCGYHLNDLWLFRPYERTWKWISGSSFYGSSGSYGQKGVPSTTNVPGAREGSVSWYDGKNKKLWLFGGSKDTRYFNDLWSYSIDDKIWTWVSGNSSFNVKGHYGDERGIPSNTIYPGGRESAISWIDEINQSLWLFGGFGYDKNGNKGNMNDLWMYSIDNDTWIWVGGSDTVYIDGVYGEKGFPSQNNIPSPRGESGKWIDKANRKFWLFGGMNELSTYKEFNDLWSISIDQTDGIHCNLTSCYINGIIYINNTIIVDYNLTITNESFIYIPSSNNNGDSIIINDGLYPINIDGGSIFIDISNDDDYKNFIENIRDNNGSLDIIIIDGKYNGSFDKILLELPSNSDKYCDIIKPKFKESSDKMKYSLTFKIESNCSSSPSSKRMKWWMILLITISVVSLFSIVIAVLAYKKIICKGSLSFNIESNMDDNSIE